MAKLITFCLCIVLACVAGQRITTIQLDGVQYFVSRMNPYSPELNYFLAYQYCRSLGLQLASFETKEKVESMSTYLQNAGYSKYDFWTSGNRLGTGMFLWMSTGLPFNATFDYFENSLDAVQAGRLDPVDHNSNTSPQRTARDSSSGLEKGCVMLKAPSLKWAPEDCSAVKDFICEQTRCYYYNYGSIPVSSAQGRPITSTTPNEPSISFSTTPIPFLISSTFATLAKKSEEKLQDLAEPSLSFLKSTAHVEDVKDSQADDEEGSTKDEVVQDEEESPSGLEHIDEDDDLDEEDTEDKHEENEARNLRDEDVKHAEDQQLDTSSETSNVNANSAEPEHIPENLPVKSSEEPSVEQRIKQISQEIEKLGSVESEGDIGRKSFLSLSDLIKTLRPNDKKIPQIDSDYSNTMRVLGETSSLVGNDESRKFKDSEATPQVNRALY